MMQNEDSLETTLRNPGQRLIERSVSPASNISEVHRRNESHMLVDPAMPKSIVNRPLQFERLNVERAPVITHCWTHLYAAC